jgi:hypothetical protein
VLPEFPEYKISSRGDVQERKTGLTLAKWPVDQTHTYRLRKDGSDRVHIRTVGTLLKIAGF